MLWRWRGVDKMSGEQVEGEVEGGFGLQWWWWFLGGKGTGWFWFCWVDRGLTGFNNKGLGLELGFGTWSGLGFVGWIGFLV